MKCEQCNGTGESLNHKELGRERREARVELGVSLRDMAELMGLSHSYLCQLELGRRAWGSTLLRRFDLALGGVRRLSESEGQKIKKPSKQRDI